MIEIELWQAIMETISNASGWVLFASSWVLFALGFWKGWWVPGRIYDREVERGDKAEDAVEKSEATVDKATDATRVATETAGLVASELAAWRRAMELDRRSHE